MFKYFLSLTEKSFRQFTGMILIKNVVISREPSTSVWNIFQRGLNCRAYLNTASMYHKHINKESARHKYYLHNASMHNQ